MLRKHPELLILVFLLGFLFAAVTHSADKYTERYDKLFAEASMELPEPYTGSLFSLKAQCAVESSLDPTAISPSGAVGLCQFMPDTYSELHSLYPDKVGIDPFDAKNSVMAAALYMSYLTRYWEDHLKERYYVVGRNEYVMRDDAYSLALLSYISGVGNVKRAISRCYNHNYNCAAFALYFEVSRDNAETAKNYVSKVKALRQEMINEN